LYLCEKDKGEMANSEINNYIEKRYNNWLDSAKYRCKLSGIPGDAMDVLQEVLCSLLQKDTNFLQDMLHREKDGYTELDWFVIRMIELNATSPTSPYRQKIRRKDIDDNVDFQRVDIIDESSEDEDIPGEILSQVNIVRRVYESLELSESSKQIFEFRFFLHEDFADWEGPESQKYLYDTFNRIMLIIKGKIFKELYFQGKVA
jgi:hypothetical protein